MSKKDQYMPTPQLRWTEVHSGVDDGIVRGLIPGWEEVGPTYYKLQQLWVGSYVGEDSEWRDVPIGEAE